MDYFTTIKYSLILLKICFAVMRNLIYTIFEEITMFIEFLKTTLARLIKIDILSLFAIGILLPLGNSLQSASPRWGAKGIGKVIRFDNRMDLAPSLGWGVGLAFRPGKKIAINLEGFRGSSRQEFDTPAGGDRINIGVQGFSARTAYTIKRFPGDITLAAEGGLGLLALKTPAYTIDLGALGQQQISARDQTFADYSFGAVIEKLVGNRVTAFVSSRAHFFSASGTMRNLQVNGGLEIAFH